MLRAAVSLSITCVIQHSPQTFFFCHDGWGPRGLGDLGRRAFYFQGAGEHR